MMRPSLLYLLACPACAGALALEKRQMLDEEVWEGELRCPSCGARYPVTRGLPHLYVDDDEWAPKAREAQGWVRIHREEGIYEPVENAVDLQIPYYPEDPWLAVGRSFDYARQQLQLTGAETVLDLGAGRGWAAKHFALAGCRAVALDIVPDENVGLGRGRALMQHADTYFDAVIGDAQKLPFLPGAFDLVFCAGSLHHASDLPLLAANVARVLKAGGRLCAINEPCISILDDERAVLQRDAAHELDLGINETRPNILDYRAAFERHGFQIVRAMPAVAAGMDGPTLRQWAEDIGAIPPVIRPLAVRPTARRIFHYLANRWRSARRGLDPHSTRPVGADDRQILEHATLLWSTGELFLLAVKN